MTNRIGYRSLIGIVLTLIMSFTGIVFAETLNPDEVNPHQNAPRKKITIEQKKAAAEARKKKQKEMNDKKAHAGQQEQTNQGSPSSGSTR